MVSLCLNGVAACAVYLTACCACAQTTECDATKRLLREALAEHQSCGAVLAKAKSDMATTNAEMQAQV